MPQTRRVAGTAKTAAATAWTTSRAVTLRQARRLYHTGAGRWVLRSG